MGNNLFLFALYELSWSNNPSCEFGKLTRVDLIDPICFHFNIFLKKFRLDFFSQTIFLIVV
jgi:hypothetical protein